MKCPRCQLELRRSGAAERDEFDDVIVDICPKCQGLWLDRGELSRLDNRTWVDIDDYRFIQAEGAHAPMRCPNCDAEALLVSPTSFPELVLDRCPDCEGFWLDRGELEQVREAAGRIHGRMLNSVVKVKEEPQQSESLHLFWPLFILSQNDSG